MGLLSVRLRDVSCCCCHVLKIDFRSNIFKLSLTDPPQVPRVLGLTPSVPLLVISMALHDSGVLA